MTDGNEPAFAKAGWYQNPDIYVDEQLGLTKREYFAAMALQGLLADAETAKQFETSPIGIPQTAVMAADALIEALNKQV